MGGTATMLVWYARVGDEGDCGSSRRELAVLLVREDEQVKKNLPLKILPPVHEGDILDMTITKDLQGTKEAHARVSGLLE
jgi:hypothetical protein